MGGRRLDHDGGIPAFVSLTNGKVHEVTQARKQRLPVGSMVVMDKGYLDYSWYKTLSEQGVFFVTRARKNTRYRVTARRAVDPINGPSCRSNDCTHGPEIPS